MIPLPTTFISTSASLDTNAKLKRNNEITIAQIKKKSPPDAIVISQDLGAQKRAGICLEVIKNFLARFQF